MSSSEKPKRQTSWSQRGYKTIYVTASDKEELARAAREAKEPSIRDYIMNLHRRNRS